MELAEEEIPIEIQNVPGLIYRLDQLCSRIWDDWESPINIICPKKPSGVNVDPIKELSKIKKASEKLLETINSSIQTNSEECNFYTDDDSTDEDLAVIAENQKRYQAIVQENRELEQKIKEIRTKIEKLNFEREDLRYDLHVSLQQRGVFYTDGIDGKI